MRNNIINNKSRKMIYNNKNYESSIKSKINPSIIMSITQMSCPHIINNYIQPVIDDIPSDIDDIPSDIADIPPVINDIPPVINDIQSNINLPFTNRVQIPYNICIYDPQIIDSNAIKSIKFFIVNKTTILNPDETCNGYEIIIYNNSFSDIIIRSYTSVIHTLGKAQTIHMIYSSDIIAWIIF